MMKQILLQVYLSVLVDDLAQSTAFQNLLGQLGIGNDNADESASGIYKFLILVAQLL
jgi:hypothetical protein